MISLLVVAFTFMFLAGIATEKIYRSGLFNLRQRLLLSTLVWFVPVFGPIVVFALAGGPEKPIEGEAPLQSDIGAYGMWSMDRHW
jgi:hypothetical protein